MSSQTLVRHYARIVRHFVSARAAEVLALQASPIFGVLLGGFRLDWQSGTRAGMLLLGSLALTAHIFVFNDWAGYGSDVHDPMRETSAAALQGISRREVRNIAVVLLIFAGFAFASVGILSLLLGAAIVALSLLYSCSANFGKRTPIVGSINHLLGGALHFLLGYSLVHDLDTNGLVMSLFFGLVFAGGHLNQEVRDYEGDLLSEIKTTAVVFGRQRTFLASLGTFTAAYAIIAILAWRGILPRLLLFSPILWILHIAWSLQALHRGLGFKTAVWMQQRYRLLFALVGLAMLAR